LRQLHMISPPMEKPMRWNLGPSCRLSADVKRDALLRPAWVRVALCVARPVERQQVDSQLLHQCLHHFQFITKVRTYT
jgi:hypothetical protein